MRVYNFSPGPSQLPTEVLEQCKDELLNYKGTGMSIMELNHRTTKCMDIIDEANVLLRDLMHIPKNYKIIWSQGGASLQFSMIPLNLYKNGVADYATTGVWAEKAISQAKFHIKTNEVSNSADKKHTYIPKLKKEDFTPNADYFHYTINNSVHGTAYYDVPPTTSNVVGDMTSCILSQEYDVSKFAIIYASCQKNLGISGNTVVIIREDLIGNAVPNTSLMLDYKPYVEWNSAYNTPPVHAIYMSLLIMKWIKKEGGVAAIEKINKEKARLLYEFLDSSKMFSSYVTEVADRSIMNIPFTTNNKELDDKFIESSIKEGLTNLKGFATMGGMRASIYNAMPLDGVKKLISFMKEFESTAK